MEVKKMDGRSMDLQQHNVEALGRLFPEVVLEGKVDMEQLVLILGEKQETADAEERYRFTWAGKREAIRASQRPSMGTLLPDREGSSNWDTTQNLYIEGDNLEVLKLLQKSYFERVKMIYIDPPYNTGKDFVYPDNFKSPLANYFEVTGQVDGEGNRLTSNAETSGRYHTDWLNMIYPRLRLARNLLREDGVIFISIDDNEVHNLRKVCDEIFGEENFVADIIWNSTKSVTNTALISVSHTHNLVYFKNQDYFIENRNEFRLEEKGDGFSNPDNDPRGPWKADPFQVGGWRPNQQYEITNPNTGEVFLPNEGNSWKNDYTKFQELVADGRIVFGTSGNAGPQRKRFKSEALERGRVAKTLWDDIDTTTNGTQQIKDLFNGSKAFSNPKPVSLIMRMLELGASKDSIVLDFFSGSATTAHAVMQLNAEDGGKRRFIMVQLPEPTPEGSEARKAGYENISQIGMERIRRAGAKLREEYPLPAGELDTGFRLYRLGSSNIKAWMSEEERGELQQLASTAEREQAIEALQKRLFDSVENIVEGRTEEDLLYELALKMGLDLSSKVERRGGNSGKDIFVVGEGALMICLGDDITWEIADDLIALHKEYDPAVCHFIFKDNGFVDDKAKTNTLESLKSAGFPAQSFTTV